MTRYMSYEANGTPLNIIAQDLYLIPEDWLDRADFVYITMPSSKQCLCFIILQLRRAKWMLETNENPAKEQMNLK